MSKRSPNQQDSQGILASDGGGVLPWQPAAAAQTAVPQAPPGTQSPSAPGRRSRIVRSLRHAQKPRDESAKAGETHITPEEAKQLFGLVDQLLKFSSQETGLPIKSDVKRQTHHARRGGELSDREVQ